MGGGVGDVQEEWFRLVKPLLHEVESVVRDSVGVVEIRVEVQVLGWFVVQHQRRRRPEAACSQSCTEEPVEAALAGQVLATAVVGQMPFAAHVGRVAGHAQRLGGGHDISRDAAFGPEGLRCIAAAEQRSPCRDAHVVRVEAREPHAL